MKRKHINMTQGVGSILEILPSNSFKRYASYIPSGTYYDRAEQTWNRVGAIIYKAVKSFEYEQNK
ncbi:MAG: hypothetical protein CSB24_03790 [Deltaproteobacteria bacterium]|nr:MAG: hypothetical protein CSB24_03790 [Deltaproteobacteria bacterium]